jgi:hypothetical protein
MTTLQELAEDIKKNGLINPIWLTKTGEILDGKLRLLACEMAGIEPRFVIYEGNDPVGFTISQNALRRHMTKAQLAFVLAQLRKPADITPPPSSSLRKHSS